MSSYTYTTSGIHQEVLKALVYIKIRVDQCQIVDQRDTHH